MIVKLFMLLSIMGSAPERYDYTGENKDFPSMEACEAQRALEEVSVAAQFVVNNPAMVRGRHYEFVLRCELDGKPA